MMDNYDLWEAHDIEQEKWLERRPICCICGDHIQDETMFNVNGDIYCEECMRNEFEQEIIDE